jgi:HEAT repeat protein
MSSLVPGLLVALAVFAAPDGARAAADGNARVDADRLDTIVNLLGDSDPDMRALGLQQVREGAKGRTATKRFTAVLPKLAAEAQIGLLDALADRGDDTARRVVLEMLASPATEVRAASLRAVGALGTAADVPPLVQAMAKPSGPEPAAAKAGLIRLRGRAVSPAIAAELPQAGSPLKTELLAILAARRAKETIPSILAAAVDADPQVRMTAMGVLAKLAEPGQAAEMLPGVLKAASGSEREAAEKAVVLVCIGVKDANHRARPLLAAIEKLDADDRTALLPLLGRLGGPAVAKLVEAALADPDPPRREAGFRALCNWPDASVTGRLLDLVETSGEPQHRTAALRALVRVASLRDKRSDAARLDLLKKAMKLTTRDDERNYVLARCPAIRTIESLRFIAPYMDQPALAQQAAASVVALAHHRELRVPHESEFDRALDAAIRTSKDPKVIDQAQRYKQGRT